MHQTEESPIRIVSIHVDYMLYRAKKRTKIAEEIEKKEDSIEEGVVLFCCVEKGDELNPGSVVEEATKNILRRLGMVKARRVMIYPYAHLSNDLSSPAVAVEVLKGIERSLKSRDLEVKRAAFGWYKEFEIKSKGHPLSDLSMTICPCSQQAPCSQNLCGRNPEEGTGGSVQASQILPEADF